MSETRIALVILSAAALGACSGGEGPGGDAATGLTPTPPPVAVPPPVQPPPALPPVEALACSPCKKIAFVSTRDGNDEIYSVDADGKALTRLTHHDAYDGEPAWSPDGGRIAFVSDRHLAGGSDSPGTGDVYVMDANGGSVTRVTFTNGYIRSPTWSPDGTRIAYESSGDLRVVAAEGGAPELLFSSPGVDGQPAWSPDGSRLALVSDWFAYDFVTDVFLVNADGSGFTAVTDGNIFDQVNFEDPAWSPDGNRIAMTVSQRLGYFEYDTRIGVVGANGSDLVLLPAPEGTSVNGIGVATPSWSADGTVIAYTSCNDGRCRVAWIKADASARGEIVSDGRDPDWQR